MDIKFLKAKLLDTKANMFDTRNKIDKIDGNITNLKNQKRHFQTVYENQAGEHDLLLGLIKHEKEQDNTRTNPGPGKQSTDNGST